MKDKNSVEIFSTAPVPFAVIKNALPAMLAMLMVLVYNLADTFFVGQTNNPLQISAVSLATPVFLFFTAFGAMFGIGGTSVISRALGEGREEYARKVCAFCMWACIIVGLLMSACFLIFMTPLLELVGASADTWEMTRKYLTIVAFCGPFALIANCFNNVIRAEGRSKQAMMGQMMGNLLNVVLDPIFILFLGLGVTGAAIATVIGNVFAAGYYISYFLSGKSSLTISPKVLWKDEKVLWPVLAVGIPASLGAVLMSVSNIVVNSRLSSYGDLVVAGFGVASKVSMITGMICIGLGQGVQPLLGYCYGAKLKERFHEIMKFSLVVGFLLSLVMTILCFVFTDSIVSAFVTDAEAFTYGRQFVRILLTTSFLFGVYYVLLNAIQAIGAGKEALVMNISRQGIIFIPAVFISEIIVGMNGVIWAQPIADIVSLVLVLILYFRSIRKLGL